MTDWYREKSQVRRREEQNLLLEVMLLSIAADGVIEESEIAELARTIGELKFFAGYDASIATRFLSNAFASLDHDGFDARLKAIAEALGPYRLRLLAYGLAVRVCLADGRLPPEEETLLGKFEVAFGLHAEHARRLELGAERYEDVVVLVEKLARSARM